VHGEAVTFVGIGHIVSGLLLLLLESAGLFGWVGTGVGVLQVFFEGAFEGVVIGSLFVISGVSGFASGSFAAVFGGGVVEEGFLLEEAEEAVVVVVAHGGRNNFIVD
jgi:hypothetical protein